MNLPLCDVPNSGFEIHRIGSTIPTSIELISSLTSWLPHVHPRWLHFLQSIINIFSNGIPDTVLIHLMEQGLLDKISPLLEWNKLHAMVFLWDADSADNKCGKVSGTCTERLASSMLVCFTLSHRVHLDSIWTPHGVPKKCIFVWLQLDSNTLPCPTYSSLIPESPAESGSIPVEIGIATVFQKVWLSLGKSTGIPVLVQWLQS